MMNTFTVNLKKAVVLAALTLTPALALTSAAQADPNYRGYDRNNTAPTWNNNSRYDSRQNQGRYDYRNTYNQPRYDNRYTYTPAPRYVPSYSQPRYDVPRYNEGYDYNRGRDYRDDNSNSVTGAILGAIIGSVLAR